MDSQGQVGSRRSGYPSPYATPLNGRRVQAISEYTRDIDQSAYLVYTPHNQDNPLVKMFAKRIVRLSEENFLLG